MKSEMAKVHVMNEVRDTTGSMTHEFKDATWSVMHEVRDATVECNT